LARKRTNSGLCAANSLLSFAYEQQFQEAYLSFAHTVSFTVVCRRREYETDRPAVAPENCAGSCNFELIETGLGPTPRALNWLRLFHESLMLPNFEGDELEPIEEWEAMLTADAEERAGLGDLGDRENPAGFEGRVVPYDISMHIFMLVEPGPGLRDADGLPPAEGGRVLAGSCCELYRNSGVGLLTYIVSAEDQRGRGHARRLCAEVVRAVRAESKLGAAAPVILECHRSDTPDNIMQPAKRLLAYEKIGWRGIKEMPTVCPATADGMGSIEGLCMLAMVDGGELSAALFAEFLTEYWAACYSEDLTPLRNMLEYLQPLEHVPMVPPSEC
jgi:GNAT superfamily N-acetyltransferase